ncbi:sugar phosphate isomerase/epimerase family protein [Butyrivibrio fibrisolvens]|uniref:sugar phosphate isomerase/epimerase family protein n=1 Tax=Butyrivibrio fibrisolvens TaxID=831 RepID=UPI00040FD7F3|nr:sugar phosphate isomerase/epimerase family protein [Butyrivibrio fibrisolvens]
MNSYEKITGFADEIAQELEIQIESVKKLGIKYIEMRGVDGDNLIFHSNDKVKEIKEKLDAAGIKLSALGSPLGKIGIEDPFEPHFEQFKRTCEIAHMMDTGFIRMFSFYVDDDKRQDFKGEVFERIGRFVDYAKHNDIVLLHENEKGIYGEKAPQCRELMDEFAGDNFKAIFDFANFVQADQDTLEAYDLLKEYIVYMHIKDARRQNGVVVPAGFGDGNVKEILGNLFENGFDGFLSLEPHLFDFKGFDGLERGSKTPIATSGEVLSGYDGFKLAHESLKKILSEI